MKKLVGGFVVALFLALIPSIQSIYVSCDNWAYTWLCCLVYDDCGGG